MPSARSGLIPRRSCSVRLALSVSQAGELCRRGAAATRSRGEPFGRQAGSRPFAFGCAKGVELSRVAKIRNGLSRSGRLGFEAGAGGGSRASRGPLKTRFFGSRAKLSPKKKREARPARRLRPPPRAGDCGRNFLQMRQKRLTSAEGLIRIPLSSLVGFPSGQRGQTVNLLRELRRFESFPHHHDSSRRSSAGCGCNSMVE